MSINYPLIMYTVQGALRYCGRMIFKRVPLNGRLSTQPFFIIGAGRSGNTLLRSILCSNTKIAIPPESYILGDLVKKWSRFNFLTWDELVRITLSQFQHHPEFYTWEIDLNPLYKKLINMDEEKHSLAHLVDVIYCYYAEQKFPGAVFWGDKTPLNSEFLPYIYKLFPNAKYVHIIRDGRDAALSLFKSGICHSLKDACNNWKRRSTNCQEFGRRYQNQYYEIHYENLVQNTRKEIIELCSFLNLEFEETMLSPSNVFLKLGDTTKHKHHSNVGNEINAKSVGKWKSLDQESQDSLNIYLEEDLKKWGYI